MSDALIAQARQNEQQLFDIQKKNAKTAADLAKTIYKIKSLKDDSCDIETGWFFSYQ